jgi:hypothetical protein
MGNLVAVLLTGLFSRAQNRYPVRQSKSHEQRSQNQTPLRKRDCNASKNEQQKAVARNREYRDLAEMDAFGANRGSDPAFHVFLSSDNKDNKSRKPNPVDDPIEIVMI